MSYHGFDLNDAAARAEYYQYSPGRPTDTLIAETIKNRVRLIVSKGYTGGGVFTTGQLTHPLWKNRPGQHHYISQQMSRLKKKYDLPIRKVGSKPNGDVLWMIDFDML